MPSDCSLPPSLARTLSRREQILDELLTHYTEAQETLQHGLGGDDTNDSRLLLMPNIWTDSYRELEQTLRLIQQAPWKKHKKLPYQRLYWQLSHWYLRVRRVQKPRRRQVGHGRFVEDGYRIVIQGREDCSPQLVIVGLGLVSMLFDGEPFVPEEIRTAHLPGDEVLVAV